MVTSALGVPLPPPGRFLLFCFLCRRPCLQTCSAKPRDSVLILNLDLAPVKQLVLQTTLMHMPPIPCCGLGRLSSRTAAAHEASPNFREQDPLSPSPRTAAAHEASPNFREQDPLSPSPRSSGGTSCWRDWRLSQCWRQCGPHSSGGLQSLLSSAQKFVNRYFPTIRRPSRCALGFADGSICLHSGPLVFSGGALLRLHYKTLHIR